MGRYIYGSEGFEYKFWFACQPSDDILEFGHERQNLFVTVYYEELKEIRKKVMKLKEEFKDKYSTSYKQLRQKIKDKGYLGSSDDPETETQLWKDMTRDASKICLGLKIIKTLKETKDDLELEAEC